MYNRTMTAKTIQTGDEINPLNDVYQPGLYLVATPIGNMGDITLRALELLKKADLILCEDTRISGRLMARYGIDRPLRAYHDHNAARIRPEIINQLQQGATVALISDAGTPLISDPGYKLVRDAAAADILVSALPGPSAALAALILSALPTDRFYFHGFLPPKSGGRRKALAELSNLPATLIFYESPRRLAGALADMATTLGDRQAAVARELTKKFEELRRDSLTALAEHYRESGSPKGEVVIVVGPRSEKASQSADGISDQEARMTAALQAALEAGSLKQAVATVTADTGLPRKLVYARALELTKGR